MSDDENYDDEPPQEPQDGRRQHKYSTADMKPENPWKRICCTILTCLFCLAIMILISILMQKLFDPPEDEDWSDDAVNATDDDLIGTPGELSGEAATLPKTMQYVEDVCSETRLGMDDRQACEEACEPAATCCNPYTNGTSTCFEEEAAGCFSYAKCHSLDGFIDAAHNDLDRICARASIEINREECELACSAMQCCFTPEESCVASQFSACLDYAACQNLKLNSIDVAKTDLDKRCADKEPTCERECKEALPCSDPNSEAYRDNFVACLSYSACNGASDTRIKVAPMYSRVDPAPAILDDVCSIKGFSEFGTTKCLEACAPVQCCFEPGAGGCFGDDPLGCMEYQRCTILQMPPYDVLTYPPTAHKPTTSAPATPAIAAAGAPAPAEAASNATSPAVAPVGNETETETAESANATVAVRRMRH